MTKTVFERIGGMPSVNAAVEIFYKKVQSDNSINHFFTTTDMAQQAARMKTFLAYAFGAPMNYSGKSMRDAHAKFVKMGLNDEHFDTVGKHLVATLKELNVSEELISEVKNIVESTREDVLDR